jgi:hypothetical protein
VTALRLLREPTDRACEWRLTAWTAGLFGLGIAIAIVASSLSSN